MDIGHWEFDGTFDPEDWFGFVYRIIDLTTQQEYIGKKQFFSIRKVAVKGRKNKKTVKKESNWKSYTSSSAHINSAIEEKGKENFRFIIETLHKTKGSLTYAEVERQILENVLREKLPDGVTPKYYNKLIAAVKFIPADELIEEHQVNINNTLRKRYAEFTYWKDLLSDSDYDKLLQKFYQSQPTVLYKQLTEENRDLFFESCAIKKTTPSYGMLGKKHTDKTKEKWKGDQRRSHKGKDNGMHGKPCYYNMDEAEKEQWRENISAASKGKTKPIVTCPHCKKSGGKPAMSRHHFDNCKLKNS